jgi:ABC-type polysaccharide/polyol phosphate export permease
MFSAALVDVKEMLREQVEYRELLYQMTLRDILLRYKQSVMGFGWAIFMPLVNTAVFSVIFTRVAPVDVGIPYPLFAYSGLLVWNFFASALRFSVSSLTSNTSLVTKIYFPREIFPFSAIIVCAVDSAVASIVLIGMMIYFHTGVSATLLFLPIVIAVHVIFTAGMALILAMANLYFRDVKYLFEAVITIWMFATSVLYPTDLVTGKLGMLVRANPMTPILDAYRAVIFHNQLPAPAFYGAAALSLVVLGTGWLTFHRAEFSFAENI